LVYKFQTNRYKVLIDGLPIEFQSLTWFIKFRLIGVLATLLVLRNTVSIPYLVYKLQTEELELCQECWEEVAGFNPLLGL